jgi:hypothetical protein
MPLEDWLLNMIVTGLVSDRRSIAELFAATFFARLHPDGDTPDFESSLNTLLELHMIDTDTDEAFSATALGQAVARAGLSVVQAKHLRDRLTRRLPQSPAGWTALALSAPQWSPPAGILTGFELTNNLPVRLLYQHYDHLLEEAGFLLGENFRREPLSYLSAAKLKAFLALYEWSRLAPVQTLEERFQMHLGQIIALGETAAHLTASLALLIEAADRESPLSEQLSQHAFSLRFGLPTSLQELHSRFGEILHRGDLAALYRAEVTSVAELSRLPEEQLQKFITGKNKLKLLREKLESIQKEVDMHTQPLTNATRLSPGRRTLTKTAPGVQPESVEIDGTYERERYLVRINGFPVRLTGKSFKYFTKLAWARANTESGWIYKEDIEVGFNQARYLYRMKNEIISTLGLPWPVFENNRLGYYRLHLDPSRIHINLDNLRAHPDYELRILAGEPDTEAVS